MQWYHAECIFHAFARTKVSTNQIRTVDDLDGIDQIVPRDKEIVIKCIDAWVNSKPMRGDELVAPLHLTPPPFPADDELLFLQCCDFISEQVLLANNGFADFDSRQ